MLEKVIPHRYIYLFFLSILLFGISTGKIFMSIGTIGISVNWLFEGGFENKLKRIKAYHWAPLILSFTFILYLFWLVKTNNYDDAFKELIIKLPLLSLPIVVGTSRSFNNKELKLLLIVFFSGLLLSTIISLMIYLGIMPPKKNTGNFRDISRFMSHIRFSLLVAFTSVLSLYFVVYTKIKRKLIFVGITIWLFCILLLLQSITGLIAWLLSSGLILLWSRSNFTKKAYYLGFLWLTSVVILATYSYSVINDFYHVKTDVVNIADPEKKYIHNLGDLETENGYYLWINIVPEECKRSWNEVSNYSFEGTDNLGNSIKYTLYRYMTSKGLKKDAAGFSELKPKDILNVEKGMTTINEYNGLKKRIREILLEINLFVNYGESNYHSFSQRLVFTKTGINIIKNNFWTGVGIGEVKSVIEKQYKQNNYGLSKENQQGIHTQFVTLFITFGIVGFSLWIISVIYPMFYIIKNIRPLYFSFISIIFIGFMSDDMLERQAGVAIFIVINSILLFALNNKDQSVIGGSKV